jgi:hypothetical protein
MENLLSEWNRAIKILDFQCMEKLLNYKLIQQTQEESFLEVLILLKSNQLSTTYRFYDQVFGQGIDLNFVAGFCHVLTDPSVQTNQKLI